jgi:hypothetical protein
MKIVIVGILLTLGFYIGKGIFTACLLFLMFIQKNIKNTVAKNVICSFVTIFK